MLALGQGVGMGVKDVGFEEPSRRFKERVVLPGRSPDVKPLVSFVSAAADRVQSEKGDSTTNAIRTYSTKQTAFFRFMRRVPELRSKLDAPPRPHRSAIVGRPNDEVVGARGKTGDGDALAAIGDEMRGVDLDSPRYRATVHLVVIDSSTESRGAGEANLRGANSHDRTATTRKPVLSSGFSKARLRFQSQSRR